MKLFLHIYQNELPYVNAIRAALNAFSWIHVSNDSIVNSTHLEQLCKIHKCTHVASTSIGLLKTLDAGLEGTADDNAGYLFTTKTGLPVVLIPPLKNIHTTSAGSFLLRRYLKKLYSPDSFLRKPAFKWELIHAGNWKDFHDFLESCRLVAVDVETAKEDRYITHCGYAGINAEGVVRVGVLELDTPDVEWNKSAFQLLKLLNSTSAPKVMQNGEYDATYFLRWNAPLHNWFFDTYNMMHCMYAELPKDLAFVSAFFLLNYRFWKEEISTNKSEYNAKDVHNTLFVFLAMMREAEEYAITNYTIEFPMVFPCIHSGNEGILVDLDERERLKEIEQRKLDACMSRIGTIIHPQFNPGSPKQVLDLLQGMGFKSASGTDKKNLAQFADRGPLEEFLVELLTAARKAKKAISTYYEFELYGNRLLYKLDPAGTETGRLASKASSLWCGTQIQNQPGYCKSMYVADSGWLLGEIDNSQSESRTTAYLSQDLNLMDTVENSPDFHCTNASLFFGIPFEQLFDARTGKKLNEDIRNLAKRTNHGANYNMGADVLVETMGTKNIFKAARLLNLPISWSAREIAVYLLKCFDKAYPRIRGAFQQELIHEVRTTGKLVLPNGWTRKTFLQPWKTKPDLNAVVAHKPQSLSVQLINKAYHKVWKELQLEMGSQHLRLKAQIHDSILFQYREDAPWMPEKISEMMKIPCTVHGRTFVIPNDLDVGKLRWKAQKL